MATKKSEPNEDPHLAKLVRVYLKMRTKKEQLTEAFKKEDSAINQQMDAVRAALLDYCKEHGLEGARTADGTFFRTVETRYSTNDWDALGKFVVENSLPDLYEKRLHQGNVKQLLQDAPDIVIPGLIADSKYQVSVRRK